MEVLSRVDRREEMTGIFIQERVVAHIVVPMNDCDPPPEPKDSVSLFQ